MWESGRDFQRVWEGWEAGFMAFMLSILCHFHGLLFAFHAANVVLTDMSPPSAVCRLA